MNQTVKLLHIEEFKSGKEVIRQFKPRIPGARCMNENGTELRVCVAKRIEECASAHPRLVYQMVNYLQDENFCPYEHMSFHRYLVDSDMAGKIIRVYHLNVPVSSVKTPEDLQDLVPDAWKTREHWITNVVVPEKVTYAFIQYDTDKEKFQVIRESETLEGLGDTLKLDSFFIFLENRGVSLFGRESFGDMDEKNKTELVNEFLKQVDSSEI